MRRLALVAMLFAQLFTLSGCERHMRDMYDQPKHLPAGHSPLFADGLSSRPPPQGSVAQTSGDLAATSSGRRGVEALAIAQRAELQQRLPTPLPADLLQRGRERFTIYCVPCHSPVGDGDGRVVQRGFPSPPSFHIDRLRDAEDRHFYDVVSKGYGVMYPYANRIEPADRWAIVAYIRALQLSQHAPMQQLPASLQAQLNASPQSQPESHQQPQSQQQQQPQSQSQQQQQPQPHRQSQPESPQSQPPQQQGLPR
jgi:mono/diheme cytochrome c family protein